jgi:hypothetical protein
MRCALLVLLLVLEAMAQRPRLSRKPPAADDFDAKSVSITGTVTQADAKSVVVDASDHRILTFKIDKSTKLPTAPLEPGDHVRVQATQDREAYLTAKDISIDIDAKSAEKAPTPARNEVSQPITEAKVTVPPVYKSAKPDPDDDGPPKLRYGKPNPPPAKPLPLEPAGSSESVAPTTAQNETGADASVNKELATEANALALPPNAALIDRAREWALSFTSGLPNYVCQQFTTRYLKPPGQRDWQAKDVVSANVVYENGKEDYRNIAINGKSQSKKMEDLPGSWSTGEFGTTLRSLFSPGRRAAFRFVKQSQIIGMTASVYDYSVKRENSDWRIQLGSQAVIPAYSGRVWIDQKTARVIRIEMQADDIPVDFPLDKVESSNDYGLIRLATADQYMLPLHAETLSCERGTTFCSRNAIEFRNYHKYSGEANITF